MEELHILRLVQADIVCGHLVPDLREVVKNKLLLNHKRPAEKHSVRNHHHRGHHNMYDFEPDYDDQWVYHRRDSSSSTFAGAVTNWVISTGIEAASSVLNYGKEQSMAALDTALFGYLSSEATKKCQESILSLVEDDCNGLSELERSLGLTPYFNIQMDPNGRQLHLRFIDADQIIKILGNERLLAGIKATCPDRLIITFPYRDLVIDQFETWMDSRKCNETNF